MTEMIVDAPAQSADQPTSPFVLPEIGGDERQTVAAVQQLWRGYSEARRPWLRQVEEHVRMLAGRQWDEYIPALDQFVDVTTYWDNGDNLWRDSPVFNWLTSVWFPQSLAKLTENPIQLGATPASADARDATKARILDQVFKYEWRQMSMEKRRYALYGWLLTCGRGILELQWDPDRGPAELFYGPATITLPDGTTRDIPNAPYQITEDGAATPALDFDAESGEVVQTAEAYRHTLGDLACHVVTPTSVIFPYGPEDVNEKPWALKQCLMDVSEIKAKWGIDVAPEVSVKGDDLVLSLQYDSPYGMPNNLSGDTAGAFGYVPPKIVTDGKATVWYYWHRVCAKYPRGRLLVTTADRVLEDGPNPYITEDRSVDVFPFFVFDRPLLPFRQEGTTHLEALTPLQRAQNRRFGGMMDAVDKFEQPTLLWNRAAITEDEAAHFNERGARVGFDPVGGDPARYLEPPGLPAGSAEMAGLLGQQMNLLGQIGVGSSGDPVTATASGELQREVRFDADRAWGATLRMHSYVWADFARTMLDMLAVRMEDERLLAISGEDNAADFLTVNADLFTGTIDVTPAPESAVLETRADKQARIKELIAMGLPAEVGFKVLGYPDLTRALRPGGEAYSVQVEEIVQMAQSGVPAEVLPEDDDTTHLAVLLEHMNTRAYRTYAPEVQAAMRFHKAMHEQNQARKAVEQSQLQASVMAASQLGMAVQGQQADAVGRDLGVLPPPMDPATDTTQGSSAPLQAVA